MIVLNAESLRRRVFDLIKLNSMNKLLIRILSDRINCFWYDIIFSITVGGPIARDAIGIGSIGAVVYSVAIDSFFAKTVHIFSIIIDMLYQSVV